ncbi:hypothetical protein R84981_001771 [Carnimonas sp. R-84981]|uniref:hypothetical protein n=1 Tax=Carnimonas bestiolae TaxID=3402172 RepID=UPI003EDBD82B
MNKQLILLSAALSIALTLTACESLSASPSSSSNETFCTANTVRGDSNMRDTDRRTIEHYGCPSQSGVTIGEDKGDTIQWRGPINAQ